MRCKLTEEVIKRFYSSEITNDLYEHISKCFECKATFELLEKLNSFKFSLRPSSSIDDYILSYAIEKIKWSDLYTYFKKLSISFLVSAAVFMFVFFPRSYEFSNDTIENEMTYLENETNLFTYSYYEDISFDFLDN